MWVILRVLAHGGSSYGGSADGGTIGLLIEDLPSGRSIRRQIPRSFAVIGRRKCDIVVNDPTVSRQHVYLQRVGERVACFDLDSTHGTWFGTDSGRWDWLDAETWVRIGNTRFRLDESDDEENRSLTVVNRGSDADVRAVFRLWDPFKRDFRLTLDRPVTLAGRNSTCGLGLMHPGVLPFHCSLVITGSGVEVIHIERQRGATYVNDAPVQNRVVTPGDEIRIGPYVLQLIRLENRGDVCDLDPSHETLLAVDSTENRPTNHSARTTHSEYTTLRARQSRTTTQLRARRKRSVSSDGGIVEEQSCDQVLNTISTEFTSVEQIGLGNVQQQQLLQMTELFGAAMTAQSELLRTELGAIRQLTAELVEIQKRMAADLLQRPAGIGQTSQFGPGVSRLNAPGSGSSAVEPNLLGPVSAGPGAAVWDPAADPAAGNAVASRRPRVRPVADVEAHSELMERISQIEDERKSRWQKLVSLIPGGK